jgi:hypothetical protein
MKIYIKFDLFPEIISIFQLKILGEIYKIYGGKYDFVGADE